MAKIILRLLTKRLQIENADNDDDDKEQTHDMASRFRNRASLFVLATWTLGNHVAPDQEVVKVMMPKMMTMMMMMMMMTMKRIMN